MNIRHDPASENGTNYNCTRCGAPLDEDEIGRANDRSQLSCVEVKRAAEWTKNPSPTLADLLLEARYQAERGTAGPWDIERLPKLVEAVQALSHSYALMGSKVVGAALPLMSEGARSHLRNVLEELQEALKER